MVLWFYIGTAQWAVLNRWTPIDTQTSIKNAKHSQSFPKIYSLSPNDLLIFKTTRRWIAGCIWLALTFTFFSLKENGAIRNDMDWEWFVPYFHWKVYLFMFRMLFNGEKFHSQTAPSKCRWSNQLFYSYVSAEATHSNAFT